MYDIFDQIEQETEVAVQEGQQPVKQDVFEQISPTELSEEDIDLAYQKYVESIRPLTKPGVTRIYTREFFKKTGEARKWIESGFVAVPRSHFGKIRESTKRGEQGFMLDQAYFDAVMLGQGDPEAVYKAKKTFNARERLDPIEGGTLAEMEYGTARILPGMIEGAKQAVPSMLAGAGIAAVAGQLGPQALLPEEAITVPAGIGIGFKVGATAAWYRQGGGELLFNMREKGFDNKSSKVIASIAALPYALIEQIQIGQITPGIRQGLDATIKRSLTRLIGEVAIKYGKTLTQETAEEVTQEAVYVIAEDLAQYFEGKGLPITKEHLVETAYRLGYTAKEALKAITLLPLPGAVVDMAAIQRARGVEGPIVPLKGPEAIGPVPETKTFKGEAYRVETGTEKRPEAKTAADVVRFEQEELGNKMGITPEKLAELEKRPAADIVWVTKTKEEARHYGEDIEDYSKIVEGGEVIADIGPDGVLVLRPITGVKGIPKEYTLPNVFVSEKSPLKIQEYAILTAENPGNKPLSSEENTKRNEQLVNELTQMGYKPIPIESKYGGPVEHSFLVPGMTNDVALELGKKYNQKSVLIPKGLLYQDGSIAPADLTKINFDARQENYYSTINVGGEQIKFSIPIDFEHRVQPSEVTGPVKTLAGEVPAVPAETRPPTEPTEVKELAEKKPPKKVRRTRWQMFAMGHTIPKQLGWDDKQRRTFNKDVTGKESMKDMTTPERKKLVAALEQKLHAIGGEYEATASILDELAEALAKHKRRLIMTTVEKEEASEFHKTVQSAKEGIYNILHRHQKLELFLEALDKIRKTGPFTRYIWDPIHNATINAAMASDMEVNVLKDKLDERKIDIVGWMFKKLDIEGTTRKLTSSQRMGVYMLSKNPKGMFNLLKGMEFKPEDIIAINKSITADEEELADWMMEQWEIQWPLLESAALAANFDPKTLKQEMAYTRLLRKDADFESERDILTELAQQFTTSSGKPESGMLVSRKKGAAGPIELDAFMIFMRNSKAVNQFLEMAPLAKQLNSILNSRNFKRSLNEKTYGVGFRLVEKWLRDSVRGTVTYDMSWLERNAEIMRQKGVLFALGRNLLARTRQLLGVFNTLSLEKELIPYFAKNIVLTQTLGGHRLLVRTINNMSGQMKFRSFERDIRTIYNKEVVSKRLRGKSLSTRALVGISKTDKYVAAIAWKSVYDKTLAETGDEKTAVAEADYWVRRTQSTASPKDLPDFFRGGFFERLFTTFQTETATLGNFWAREVLGAKISGEIGWRKFSYRVLVSYVIPALLFGSIGRGRLRRTWKEALVDLLTYPVAPFIVAGNWVQRLITGLQSGLIGTAGFEGLVSLISNIRKTPGYKEMTQKEKDDLWRSSLKAGAKTIGGFTGKITTQDIRTLEGVYDLMTGQTEDWRRLIWSKRALQEKEEQPKIKHLWKPRHEK